MSHIFLVRHGESYFNKKNFLTGTIDVPVTEKGIQQISQLFSIINCKLDIVFTSILSRSVETSLALLRKSCTKYNQIPVFIFDDQYLNNLKKNILPIYKTDLLNERNYAHIQGMSYDIISQFYTQKEISNWKTTMHASPLGGECLGDVKKRTDLFYKKYLKKYLHTSLNILIVCHQNTIKTLRMVLESNEFIANPICNCDVLDYNFEAIIDN